MTYSSPRHRIIDSPATLLTTEQPLDAFNARDVVFNNLLHHADQCCARVLVNFMSAQISGKDVYISGIDGDGRWTVVESFGPFPLSVEQQAGALHAYPLRVALNAGSDGTSTRYAIQVSTSPWSRPMDAALVVDGGDVCTFVATTSASGWLTPDVDNIINPTSVLFAPRGASTLTEEGGDAVSVLCYMAYIRVLAIGVSPRLYGAHVAEVYV